MDDTVYNPSTALTFSEYTQKTDNSYDPYLDETPIGEFAGWITGNNTLRKDKYDSYLKNLDVQNEWKATQSARAWEEYMESTKYQRAVKDLQKAGLNPWLAVQSGISGVGSSSSSAKPKYDYQKQQKEEKSTGAKDIALLLLAIARVAAAA